MATVPMCYTNKVNLHHKHNSKLDSGIRWLSASGSVAILAKLNVGIRPDTTTSNGQTAWGGGSLSRKLRYKTTAGKLLLPFH